MLGKRVLYEAVPRRSRCLHKPDLLHRNLALRDASERLWKQGSGTELCSCCANLLATVPEVQAEQVSESSLVFRCFRGSRAGSPEGPDSRGPGST